MRGRKKKGREANINVDRDGKEWALPAANRTGCKRIVKSSVVLGRHCKLMGDTELNAVLGQ